MSSPLLTRAGCGLVWAAVVGWALLVLGAPWLATVRLPLNAAVRVSAATYLAGSLVCHQRADRSFHVHGSQLPVCGRCTGIYVGAAAGLLAAWPLARRGARVPWGAWRAILAVAALPTVATVLLEWTGIWAGSPLARALAGLPAGAAVGALLCESLSFRVN